MKNGNLTSPPNATLLNPNRNLTLNLSPFRPEIKITSKSKIERGNT